MTNKTINIPEEQWVDFINILYAAIQHITHTEENAAIMMTLRQIVGDAFQTGEVLVINGKIVSRDYLKDDKTKRNLIFNNKKRSNF